MSKLSSIHPLVRIQIALVAGWLLVSGATLAAVIGSDGRLGASVRAEMALGGRVLIVTNGSSSRWTDITYTLNQEYVFRQAVLEPNDHVVIPVGRFRRGGSGGPRAPRELEPSTILVSCDQGRSHLALDPSPALAPSATPAPSPSPSPSIPHPQAHP